MVCFNLGGEGSLWCLKETKSSCNFLTCLSHTPSPVVSVTCYQNIRMIERSTILQGIGLGDLGAIYSVSCPRVNERREERRAKSRDKSCSLPPVPLRNGGVCVGVCARAFCRWFRLHRAGVLSAELLCSPGVRTHGVVWTMEVLQRVPHAQEADRVLARLKSVMYTKQQGVSMWLD